MYTIKEIQGVDGELFSELIESTVSPAFLNMTWPLTGSLNPLSSNQRRIAPCKVIWIPESMKFLLVESGILGIGIQNSAKE